eukprot:TRINITY_DN4643_c0_g1_i1.p1 TRINITY_DN4643_c0_g1~~TRINITY_DN4643_c0_g1_i1.p1  ORF type:complete len:585 (-),score=117.93 TRINITY_DN4643_c0_g1_i1:137-1891(-)
MKTVSGNRHQCILNSIYEDCDQDIKDIASVDVPSYVTSNSEYHHIGYKPVSLKMLITMFVRMFQNQSFRNVDTLLAKLKELHYHSHHQNIASLEENITRILLTTSNILSTHRSEILQQVKNYHFSKAPETESTPIKDITNEPKLSQNSRVLNIHKKWNTPVSDKKRKCEPSIGVTIVPKKRRKTDSPYKPFVINPSNNFKKMLETSFGVDTFADNAEYKGVNLDTSVENSLDLSSGSEELFSSTPTEEQTLELPQGNYNNSPLNSLKRLDTILDLDSQWLMPVKQSPITISPRKVVSPPPSPMNFRVPSRKVTKSVGNQIYYKDVLLLEKLGEGGFALVYRGNYNEKNVAVKCMNRKVSDTEFKKEVKTCSLLNHPCIVEYIGHSSKRKWIIFEYMERGSLFDCIHEESGDFSWKRKIQMAIDVSSAMVYLHKHRIRHCDLSSHNILVNEQWQLKVCDLGLSEIIPDDILSQAVSFNRRMGTLRWMSPEMMKKECRSMEKSDVYSFGIVLFEIGCGEIPYQTKPDPEVVKCKNRGILPRSSNSKIWRSNLDWKILMNRCLKKCYKDRPNFLEIYEELVEMKNSV